MNTYKLTNKEYNALLTLYHDYNDAFIQLPDYIKQAFYQHIRELPTSPDAPININ